MRRGLWTILLAGTTTLLAQASYFGPRVPLTNTRYGAVRGTPVLATNGTESFLFTSTEHNVRMVALADAHRVARPVLAARDGDVAWDGSRFFVAGSAATSIVGRFVDRGEPFTVIENASKPRLALPLMLFARNGVQAVTLSADGVARDLPVPIAAQAHDFDIATNGNEIFALIASDAGVKLLSLTRDAAIVSETQIADAATQVSLASDGTDFLALWSSDDGVEAAIVRKNGTIEEPFGVAESASALSLAWSDGSYHAALVVDGEMRMLEVSPAVRAPAPVSLVVNGAAEQTLVDTASSFNTSLLVWNEDTDAHIGIRGMKGTWRERLLASDERAIAAAAHGREFAVLLTNDDGWSAMLLDENGSLIARSARVSAFRARDVALSASHIGVIGVDANRNVLAAAVARDGSVSDAFTLRGDAEDPVIASDGTNFLALWQTSGLAIEALRPGIDATPVVVFDVEAEDPAVAFNGREYVVAWRAGEFIRGRRVRTDGTPIRELVQTGRVGGTPPTHLHLTGLGDGKAGLSWLDGRAQLVLFDGWDVQTARGFETTTAHPPRVVALPLHGVGYAMSDALDDAPHHGSARVLLATAHPAPPTAPPPPRAEASYALGQVRVSWSASEAVNGYRVEYRIEGGPWLEVEGWSEGTSLAFDPPRPGRYEVRVRAFGDGGTSAYSDPVEVTVTGRRRAVR